MGYFTGSVGHPCRPWLRTKDMEPEDIAVMHRRTTPLLVIAAVFVVAGGFIHLRDWLDIYRSVPSSVTGAGVVRVGFPINVGVSALLAVALVVTIFKLRRFAPLVVGATLIFQAGSLAALIVSRTGSLAGWMEHAWTVGASQTRAVEIGAMATLMAVIAIVAMQRRPSTPPVPATVPAVQEPPPLVKP